MKESLVACAGFYNSISHCTILRRLKILGSYTFKEKFNFVQAVIYYLKSNILFCRGPWHGLSRIPISSGEPYLYAG